MKIKNFKINQKAISKLAACVLVGSITATTLTGCGTSVDRNTVLKGTFLDNACVVTFDNGNKDIAVSAGSCFTSQYNHYYSIISGEYYADDKCEKNKIEGNVMNHYKITSVENITSYLTTEELSKAIQGIL